MTGTMTGNRTGTMAGNMIDMTGVTGSTGR